MYSSEVETDIDISHYGVIGMKWGRRKNPSKAFSKASAKLDRLNAKAEKRNAKFTRLDSKSSALRKTADSSARDYAIAKSKRMSAESRRFMKPSAKKIGKLNRNESVTEKVFVKDNAKASKAEKKTIKAEKKLIKADKKVARWEKKMAKAFKNTNVKDLSPEARAAGKKYLDLVGASKPKKKPKRK